MSVLTAAVLLASSALAGPVVGWRMDGTGDFPEATPPLEWSPSRNVCWSTAMPSFSNSSPVLVGDRLLVLAEPDLLLAVDASDGRVLWQRASPLAEVAADGDPGGASEAADASPGILRWAEARTLSAQVRAREYQLTELRQRLRRDPDDGEIRDLAAGLVGAVEEMRARWTRLAQLAPPSTNAENGYASTTPVSDGRNVWVVLGTGVVASYDLDGERRWIRFVDEPRITDGQSTSPLLVGDTLLVGIEDLIALDAATGELRWRAGARPRHGTPVVFTIEGEPVVAAPSGHVIRVADGAMLARGVSNLKYASPIARDGVLYMIDETAEAFRIPQRMADELELPRLWATRLASRDRHYGSPLLVDGLIYTISRRGDLEVLEAAGGTSVYAREMPLAPEGDRNNSVFASPTRAGEQVFVNGLSGRTIVFELGRRYVEVATNQLMRSRGSPVFHGRRMYVRTHDRLYCIERPLEPGQGAGEASDGDHR